MAYGTYTVNQANQAYTTAITIIQIKTGATNPIDLLEASCGQRAYLTSSMQGIEVVRKTGAATVTSATPLLLNPGAAASAAVGGASATGVNATAEGTDSDVMVLEDFNTLSSYRHEPVPERRVRTAAALFTCLKFTTTPAASITVDAQMQFLELV